MGYAPSDYQFDPRQVFDPEQIGPPPPGYGVNGLNPDGSFGPPQTLNEFKQERDAVPLPRNPDGSTSSPQEFGPEPPIFYATNVPETAQKWGKAGQKYTFLAESPQAVKTAEELGAPRVMRGYDPALDQAQKVAPPAIGPEPGGEELEDFTKAQGFWKHVVNTQHGGVDYTKINPEELAMKKRAELQKKYDLELFNAGAESKQYKERRKLIEQEVKDTREVAERQRSGAIEKMKEVMGFAKSKFAEERKIAGEERRQKGLDTLANVDKAQKFTQALMEGENAPWNYELSQDELKASIADPTLPLTGKRLKPIVLTNINRERERAGLPPIVEEKLPASREYTDWWLFKTGEKVTKQYGYEEGPAPARRSAAPGPVSTQPATLPDASQHAGRSGKDTNTGRRYRSNGNQWVEIR